MRVHKQLIQLGALAAVCGGLSGAILGWLLLPVIADAAIIYPSRGPGAALGAGAILLGAGGYELAARRTGVGGFGVWAVWSIATGTIAAATMLLIVTARAGPIDLVPFPLLATAFFTAAALVRAWIDD